MCLSNINNSEGTYNIGEIILVPFDGYHVGNHYVIISVNSINQIFTLNDLSEEVSTADKVKVRRYYLTSALTNNRILKSRTLDKLQEVLISYRRKTFDVVTSITMRDKQGRQAKTIYQLIDNYYVNFHPFAFKIKESDGELDEHGYHKYFSFMLKTLQDKEMIDISLGLDVLVLEFYPDQINLGLGRHHPERDRDYVYVFEFDKKDSSKWTVKLFPLENDRHRLLHGYHEDSSPAIFQQFEEDHALAQARITHLVELIYTRRFDPTIKDPYKYYKDLFMKEFKDRRVEVNGLSFEIWAEAFSNRDLLGNLVEWVERWVDRKRMGEKKWYNTYYKTFYQDKYLKRLRFLINNRPEFLKWYIDVYRPNNRYPTFSEQ